jgi:cbb3-type cytochrome oxidase subunit 1
LANSRFGKTGIALALACRLQLQLAPRATRQTDGEDFARILALYVLQLGRQFSRIVLLSTSFIIVVRLLRTRLLRTMTYNFGFYEARKIIFAY